jgi:phosphate transport system permease protein
LSSIATPQAAARAAELRRRGRFRPGDAVLHGLTLAAALAAVALLGLIAWKVTDQARPAIHDFGLGFLTTKTWDPGTRQIFGAAAFLFGTAVTSLGALLIAGPLSIAIALFLTELAPRWLRGPIGALVEMLAAVPSVVVGLWGILVMGPFVADHLEPFLKRTLGFIPLFRGDPSIFGLLPAILVLTIMITPIVSSVSRELFLGVPRDLKEGALALGTTRWEMIRGVVFPYARSGIAAALILGLGRAVGEAIAVTQVIGGSVAIHWSLFQPGDTLASRIASQYQGASTAKQISAIAYLAVILLCFSLVANIGAQAIVRRFAGRHPVAR